MYEGQEYDSVRQHHCGADEAENDEERCVLFQPHADVGAVQRPQSRAQFHGVVGGRAAENEGDGYCRQCKGQSHTLSHFLVLRFGGNGLFIAKPNATRTRIISTYIIRITSGYYDSLVSKLRCAVYFLFGCPLFIWVLSFYLVYLGIFYLGTQFLFGCPLFLGTRFSFGYPFFIWVSSFYLGVQFLFGYPLFIWVPSFYLGT